ncbi:MAG: hypothetical protein P9L94_00285 [Candidatus Hinthialibacter antarcticus]|nr:hypothetical protein [Candidatus Hinthialibacter antarcticus]
MDRIQRIFYLKNIPAFDSLRDHEIDVIAEVLSERAYDENSIVVNAGAALSSMLITVSGGLVTRGGQALPIVVGAPSLLFGWELGSDIYSAAGEKTVCLTLRKGLFFTLVYECPAFLFAMLGKTEGKDLYFSH